LKTAPEGLQQLFNYGEHEFENVFYDSSFGLYILDEEEGVYKK
jgi:hypothetical protein